MPPTIRVLNRRRKPAAISFAADHLPIAMNLPFHLLALAIAAVWCPDIRLSRRVAIAPWAIAFLAAVACAVASGIVTSTGVLVLSTFALLCGASKRAPTGWRRHLTTALACVFALGLALRFFPGFNDHLLFSGVRISPESPPFRLNLNFSKGCAGLFLLVFYARRIASLGEARALFKPGVWMIVFAVPFLVLAVATLLGGIRFDPKWPAPTLAFLGANLFFTCVAEEAFFRGLVQERLHRICGAGRFARWIPVFLVTAVFVALHPIPNVGYLTAAALAGLGYSIAYARVRRIEPAILAHFLVNALHFVLFTYPYPASAS